MNCILAVKKWNSGSNAETQICHKARLHFGCVPGYFNTTSRSPDATLPVVTLPPGQRTVISAGASGDGKIRTGESCDQ